MKFKKAKTVFEVKHKLIILSFALIIIVYGCSNSSRNLPVFGIKEGALEQAPDFSLTTLDGKTITKSDFKDKVVLMQVFAAWCPTCITEARNIQQVRNEFSEKDLEIVFFDVQQGETKEQIEEFIKKSLGNEGKWHWALTNPSMAPAYGVRTLEQTFLINKNGEIAYTDFGFTNPNKISQVIKELI